MCTLRHSVAAIAAAGCTRRLAQQTAYCLRKLDLIERSAAVDFAALGADLDPEQLHLDYRGWKMGEVIEILGDHLAPGMATDVAIRAHDIPLNWPETVEAEIAAARADVSAARRLKALQLAAYKLGRLQQHLC